MITHSAYIPPAQLLIGPAQAAQEQIILYLQKILCISACQSCSICSAINHKQYHALCWFEPNSYTKELLEPIHVHMRQARDQHNPFFFIITAADYMNQTCANSLLKKLEEPNPGYHFILTASRKEALLKTIISRCSVAYIPAQPSTAHDNHPLFVALTAQKTSPKQFLVLLEQQELDEKSITTLLQELLVYWIMEYNKKINSAAEHMVTCIQEYIQNPPLPGSYKLLLKQLYLEISKVSDE